MYSRPLAVEDPDALAGNGGREGAGQVAMEYCGHSLLLPVQGRLCARSRRRGRDARSAAGRRVAVRPAPLRSVCALRRASAASISWAPSLRAWLTAGSTAWTDGRLRRRRHEHRLEAGDVLVLRVEPGVELRRLQQHRHPVVDRRHRGIGVGGDDAAGVERAVRAVPALHQTRRWRRGPQGPADGRRTAACAPSVAPAPAIRRSRWPAGCSASAGRRRETPASRRWCRRGRCSAGRRWRDPWPSPAPVPSASSARCARRSAPAGSSGRRRSARCCSAARTAAAPAPRSRR